MDDPFLRGMARAGPAAPWLLSRSRPRRAARAAAAGPSGMKLSSLATRAIGPAKPDSTSAVITPSPTPPVSPGLVDHQRPAGAPDRREHVGDRQRSQPAQVEHVGGDSRVGQPPGDPQAHRHAVAEGDHGQLAVRPELVEGGVEPGPSPIGMCVTAIVGQPRLVAVGVQVAPVVERDRLQEDRQRRVGRGRGHAGAEQARRRRRRGPGRRSPGRGCRAAHRPRCRCGSGRRNPSGRPARPPGRPSGCGTRPRGEERQRGALAAELVLGVVQVGQVLDLRDGDAARPARPPARGPGSTARPARCRRPGRCRAAGPGRRSPRTPRPWRRRPHRRRSPVGSTARIESRVALIDSARVRGLASDGLAAGRAAVVGDPAPDGAGRERGHHLGRRAAAAATSGAAARPRRRSRCGWRRSGPAISAGSTPAPISTRAVASSGIAVVVGLDVPGSPVGDLGVAAGVAEEPHGLQVQEDRPARARVRGAHGLGDRPPGGHRVGPVGRDVVQPGPGPVRGLDPPAGVGTEMPQPLSSQTNRIGAGSAR